MGTNFLDHDLPVRRQETVRFPQWDVEVLGDTHDVSPSKGDHPDGKLLNKQLEVLGSHIEWSVQSFSGLGEQLGSIPCGVVQDSVAG